ncbi:MAG: crossover junction endodeoxyribonuclease RuvC, partial [Elusimicrobia bacterium]|nr:crossover junction endodeoxyribonuclease RuvC [Elusimicrobiota bacterium]
ARGVVLLTAEEHGLPVAEYAPKTVKIAVTGYGSASKQQISRMVQTLLRLPAIPKPDDVADALAVSLCHAQSALLGRMANVS